MLSRVADSLYWMSRYFERADHCARVLEANYNLMLDPSRPSTETRWHKLRSATAFEAYCKVYTADLKPERVAEFLLLNSEFPYSVRYSAERMKCALEEITESSAGQRAARLERIIGGLRASLAYVQIGDIMSQDIHRYLNGVLEQCRNLHAALHQVYIDYPIEAALEV